ncbi:MFS general substrate transporter [Mollisia scopiformis]|uniref:MFS general substrate transporter n=1 Tax=Mollisia scopiformis TaxID=149040 RepID=A0A194XBP4_MOLSC|nr:MFS general substrate transporter [Mollisia scopiformis]KUJ17585.1 MFS general substrate transporter [Mollisia scopiformis]
MISSEASFSRWTAWAQVLAGHLIIFDTFGYIGSWGFFESYYEKPLNASLSSISWIGSVQIFLVYFIGTFSGRALDAGYLKTTVALGCFCQVLGIFMTSCAKSYAFLFLSQGVLVGIGNGLAFCPMISLISTYYTNKSRALAVSFAAAGAATGGIIFPIIARNMLGGPGIGWTLRVMGFVFLSNSVVAISLLRVHVKPRKSGPLIEWAAFRELPYLLFCLGTFLALWGVYFAYYYISVFGKTIIQVPPDQLFYLIMALNGIGIFGRVLPAWLVTRVPGVLYILIPMSFMAGLMLYLWALVTSKDELIIWIVFYGFFANAVQGLFVGGVGSLTKDKQKMGVRIGMVFTIVSFASLTGPPIAGALIDARDGNFLYAQIFGGTVMVCSSSALIMAAISKRKADLES